MQKETTSTTGSPFFSLLTEAEEIRIKELPSDQIDQDGERGFIVFVKTPLPPKSKKTETHIQEIPREFLLESAGILIRDKDFLLARNIYSYLLKKDIRDNHALKGLGICLLKLGENVSARKCFRALRELYHDEEASAWLGFCAVLDGDQKQASDHFNEVLSPNALPEELRFEYFKEHGNAQTRLGRYEAAHSAYIKALEIRPDSDGVYVNLGTLELQRKAYELAHANFAKAVQINGRNSKAYCGLGLVAIELEQTVFAKKQFETALDLDSQNTVALMELARMSSGDSTLAPLKERLNRFLLKDAANTDIRYTLATCLFKEGNYREAELQALETLKHDPSHIKTQKLLSDLSTQLHRQGGLA